MKRMFCFYVIFVWSLRTLGITFHTPTSHNPKNPLPTWQITRGNLTSFIIGTPPINPNIRKLSSYYLNLIRSRPNFLTEIGGTRAAAEPIKNYLLENIHEGAGQGLVAYLDGDQISYIKQTMRRLSLTNTPKWMQIFIPGYAGIVGESAAQISPFLPPVFLASAMISAATGIGLGSGPTVDELLLKAARSEQRKIILLRRTLDTEVLLHAVGPEQLKSVLDYIQTQHERNEPVAFGPAMQKMLESINSEDAAKLIQHSLSDTAHNVEIISAAHENGGAVIVANLLELLSEPGHNLFAGLEREGFTVTLLNNSYKVEPENCTKLLR